jgi:hypothetical protein
MLPPARLMEVNWENVMPKAVAPLLQESHDRSLRQSRCFVMMPSGRNEEYGQGEVEANFVFDNIIEPAINNVLGKGSADRESDSLEPRAITPKIIQKLNDYDFAVVDITGGNPNVFLNSAFDTHFGERQQ